MVLKDGEDYVLVQRIDGEFRILFPKQQANRTVIAFGEVANLNQLEEEYRKEK